MSRLNKEGKLTVDFRLNNLFYEEFLDYTRRISDEKITL